MTHHPYNTVATLESALKETFTPYIFVMERGKEDLLRITSLPLSMEGLVIPQPIREATLNHNIFRVSTSHAVTDILVEVVFDTLSHDATMT